jgi:hypothetical protein
VPLEDGDIVVVVGGRPEHDAAIDSCRREQGGVVIIAEGEDFSLGEGRRTEWPLRRRLFDIANYYKIEIITHLLRSQGII